MSGLNLCSQTLPQQFSWNQEWFSMIWESFSLKSQRTQSIFKTVIAWSKIIPKIKKIREMNLSEIGIFDLADSQVSKIGIIE